MFTKPLADRYSRRCARGQALTELLVVMLFLLSAIVLIPLLGKYQSVQLATIAAARDLAFDCTVRLEQCDHADGGVLGRSELPQRMFAAADAPIQARPATSHDAASANRPPLWVDGRGSPMLSGAAAISILLTRPSLDAGRAVAISANGSAGRSRQLMALEQAGPAQFGWQMTEGLLVARVRTQLGDGSAAQAPNGPALSGGTWRAPHAPMALRLTANTAIVADAWNASGADLNDGFSVADRVAQGSSLDLDVEQQLASAYAPMIRFAGQVRDIGLERYAPAARKQDIDPDLVPADRLPESQ